MAVFTVAGRAFAGAESFTPGLAFAGPFARGFSPRFVVAFALRFPSLGAFEAFAPVRAPGFVEDLG
jgi:hypothetical protein